jgi:peptidoglycan/LPS O-acetylase OafA/YrhL
VPKPAKGPHITYRPGLDGVRALAVIGVFFYHAWPNPDGGPWLPGGFLGVDLFFVLSGYLITSILLVEWQHHRRINLLRFWARRARRLFPALVVVVLGSLLLSAIFARGSLAVTRSDTLSSLFYFNNWHQIAANSSYFVRMGNPSLLRHYWSLAVEEQFYILWPLLLVPGLIFIGRRWMPLAIAVVIAASATEMWLLYNGPDSDPSRVYYGTDTRAFLLLMGIELAFFWPYVERIRRSLPLLELLGFAALGITLWLFTSLQDYDAVIYQGGDLAAAFCFAVLIAAVAHPRTIIGKGFGVTPLRWIGERSYGIYLWHWPIIVLLAPSGWWTGWKIILAQGLVTVGIATLSYRFVEQPIRTQRVQKRIAKFDARRRAGVLAVGAAALVVTFAVLYIAPSAPSAQASSGPSPPAHHHHHRRHRVTKPGHHGHEPTKRTLPPGHYLAMGDSVMYGCRTALEQALDYRVRVDAQVSRQIKDVIAEFDRIRHKYGSLPKVVIVQVGNNGPLLYGDLVNLRHALRGVPDVIVVNVRVGTTWENESNDAILGWIKDWPEAHLADWYHHSSDSMTSDHTHPKPQFCPVYGHVIATALRASVPRS